jgi:hypothetical protein
MQRSGPHSRAVHLLQAAARNRETACGLGASSTTPPRRQQCPPTLTGRIAGVGARDGAEAVLLASQDFCSPRLCLRLCVHCTSTSGWQWLVLVGMSCSQ